MPARTSSAVLPESVAIAVVGCADLLVTVYLVASGLAYEGNPWMRAVLEEAGPWGLAAAKAAFLAAPLAIVEMARPGREAFVRRALRWCLALYIGLYALLAFRGGW